MRSWIGRTSVAMWVLGAGLLLTACQQEASTTSAPKDAESLSPKQLTMLMKADAVHNEGMQLKDQGAALRAEGKEGEPLLRQGDEKLAEAARLRAEAMQMKD